MSTACVCVRASTPAWWMWSSQVSYNAAAIQPLASPKSSRCSMMRGRASLAKERPLVSRRAVHRCFSVANPSRMWLSRKALSCRAACQSGLESTTGARTSKGGRQLCNRKNRVGNELVRQASKLSRQASKLSRSDSRRMSQSSLASDTGAGAGLKRKPSVRVLGESLKPKDKGDDGIELQTVKLKVADEDDSDGSYGDSDEDANQYMSAIVSRQDEQLNDGELPDLQLAGSPSVPAKKERGVRISEGTRAKRRDRGRVYEDEDWFGYDNPDLVRKAGVPVRALRPVDFVDMEPEDNAGEPLSAVPSYMPTLTTIQGTPSPPRSPANPLQMKAVPASRLSASPAPPRAASPSPGRASEDVTIAVVTVPLRGGGPMNPADARAMPRAGNRRVSVARRQRRAQKEGAIPSSAPKLARMNTFVRKQVASMPTFKPWFIWTMTIAQIIVMIVELAVGGISPIGFSSKTVTGSVPSFSGDMMSVSTNKTQNFWIGPDTTFIIHWGAKYTPCMRKDAKTFVDIDRQNAIDDAGGCCQMKTSQGVTRCGWQSLQTCNSLSGTFTTGASCDNITACAGKIVTRPCCVGYSGQCVEFTEEACSFYDGYYHAGASHCGDVSCLEDVCGFGGMSNPDHPDQGGRFVVPIFLHVGIFHLFFNLLMQIGIGRQIERTAGWLRTGIIYMLSGIGGNLFSAIFVPYQPQVGASGALYGLLAVLVVELFQSWQLLTHPWKEMFKLIIVVAVSLMIGTLPWVDNFAHIGGFLTGILAGIIFLPYIVFGKWDARRKRILIGVAVPVLIALFVIGFIMFYQAQGADFCPWCKYLDCIPYTKNFCDGVNIG
eukprot:Opistho-2@32927